MTEGLKQIDIKMPKQRHNSKPVELLNQIKMSNKEGIYLLIDFHPFLDDPVHVRLLKDIALMKGESLQRIVLISHEIELPEELQRYSARFELSMPDHSQIEKGISVGQNDGGTSSRMLGKMLTWMPENKERVFIVATANDIEMLPPELIRKGRLDEIFFVDLPDSKTREIIFIIHLVKREQDPKCFNIASLVEKSDGFSGSEIEQAIVSSFYASFAQKTALSDSFLIEELAKTSPLFIVMTEKIESLRFWAQSRIVIAN